MKSTWSEISVSGRSGRIIFLLVMLLACSASVSAQSRPINISWLPVTEAERNMKSPVVENDAGVEALFWRVHVVDEVTGQDLQRVLYHYVRLKVFDEKGKAQASTIDLPFGDKALITYITGRTIKADGTQLDLKNDSIYERDLVKGGGSKRKVKSFAMPGVEPGSIIEYRWKETRYDPSSLYIKLHFQREFPVQKVTYFLRPLSREVTTYTMSVWPLNCRPSPLKREDDGFNSITLENVQAFRDEPLMPGEGAIRPWALVFYYDGRKREPEKYWHEVGRQIYKDIQPGLKTNNEIRQAANQAAQGAVQEEEKILGLIRYLRANLRDLYGHQVTEAERAKIIKEMPEHRVRSAAEVFKSGIGTADELNTLFAAMASQVGLDARPAMIADREDVSFHREMTERYFLRNVDMAVKIGGKWKLYDVSARLLPSSMLSWREEGMQALISDAQKPEFVTSEQSPPDASLRTRTAKLALSEDGAIEGDVDLEYSGHMAFDRRNEWEGDTEARRSERLKEDVSKLFANSEITAIRFENVDDPEKPLKLHYHLKVPGYAQRTGKRLLLQPLFFQQGTTPLLAAADRRYPVSFHYAWKERDMVSITMPGGFSPDNAENPGSIEFGAPGSYGLEVGVRGGNELVSIRTLTFGNKGLLLYDVKQYPKVKALFDEIHRRDTFTLSLKQGGAK